MRKIFTIFCLLAFLFGSSGYLVLFKIAQFKVRQEVKSKIKSQIPENLLTVIKFSIRQNTHSGYNPREKNEFWYKGKLYDVVKFRMINDSIYYYCMNDRQEEKLFSNLADEIKNSSEQQNASKNLVKIINLKSELIYYFKNPVHIPKNVATNIIYHDFKIHYKSPYSDIQSPPPKIS